jgi:hypothetical protein
MRKRIVFAALVAWLCTACASTSRHVGGHYDRVNDLYTNKTAGFSLAIPELQDGPLLDIATLVQKMRAMPDERVSKQLTAAHVTDVQQLSVRTTLVNGYEAAEWIYSATDMTGGQPIKVTVSFFILKVNERYVYLTFSVPSSRYATTQPAMTSILQTFTRTSAV